ncbi:sigma-E processing peptidase SpoIIGA [Bacillota bacterium LX-D]|nr:sigma-E processing peptidase SpoIIGA [Bacillota bacterium LX-D]
MVKHNYIIYLDIVFLINFAMDFILLWAVWKFGHFKTSLKRLLWGAAIGSCYAIAIFLPELNWLLTCGIKLLFSLIIIFITFEFISWRNFLMAVGCFYLVSFVAAGAMLGAIYFFSTSSSAYNSVNGVLTYLGNLQLGWLITGLCMILILGYFTVPYLRQFMKPECFLMPVVIKVEGHSLSVQALLDTGNHLRDPFNKKPVMIIEYAAIKEILPSEICQILKGGEIGYEQFAQLDSNSSWYSRLKLIPYGSIGESGLLLAFRPDLVSVQQGEKQVNLSDVVVAISNKNLSSQGTYRALLHQDMFPGKI